MAKNYFTQDGYSFAQFQITSQQSKVRTTGREAGDEAGVNCDWHDNFGYEDAKRRLEQESERLQKLIQAILGCEIIEVREQNERVAIGVTVRGTRYNKYDESEEAFEITIGAFGESLPIEGLVSYNAPVVSCLMGMAKGDLVENVTIAGKKYDIEISEILPPSFRYAMLSRKLFGECAIKK